MLPLPVPSQIPGWLHPFPYLHSARPEFMLWLTGEDPCIELVCVLLSCYIPRTQGPVTAPSLPCIGLSPPLPHLQGHATDTSLRSAMSTQGKSALQVLT